MSVEVVIATYPGGERYLEETVASFRSQGVEPRVVNDDRPTEVKWNEAIETCTADYLCLAHHDDIYLPSFVSEMGAFLRAHPAVVAAFCFDYLIDQEGNRIGQTPIPPACPDVYDFRGLFADTLTHGNILRCETVVFNRKVLGDLRFPGKELCGNAHDTQFWFELAARHPIGVVKKRLVRYRIHPDSDTQKTVAGKENIGHLKALEYAAGLRPLDVDFQAHIAIAQGLEGAYDRQEAERVRKRAGEGCWFAVVHEPPDNAGTGVVVAERLRRCNRGDNGHVGYYVYPVGGEEAEIGWERGVPVVRCPRNGFGDVVAALKPSKIEFHHLLGWPFNILEAPAEEKSLFLHDSYLWCARYHSVDGAGEVCNRPEFGKCADCSGQTRENIEKKSAYIRKTVPSLARVVANSDYTAKYAREHLGVDALVEHPSGPLLTASSPRRRIGYFGGFYPVKGVGVLLKAMRILPEVVLEMHSDLPKEWLNGRRLYGYDNVLVMGAYKRSDLPTLVNGLAAVVVPSLNESYGLVAREIRSLGVPVIATRTGGLDGTVPPGDAYALAEAIKGALCDNTYPCSPRISG